MSNTLVYELENKLYINLTNRCTNDCIFCLRNDKDEVCGSNLWLESEEFTAQDVIEQLIEQLEAKRLRGEDAGCSTVQPLTVNKNDEVVFCGYGEPTLKLDILKEVAQYIRTNYPEVKIRLNTNGHGNSIHKRNIAAELNCLVDEVSVSLNAPTAEQYDELSQPKIKNAYNEVLDFMQSCSDNGIKTTASVVEGYKAKNLDLAACEKTAQTHGAQLRVREWIENGY